MAGTKNTDVRNDQVSQLANFFDRLDLDASDGTTLVTFTLSWGSASSGSISLSGTPYQEDADETGTVDSARLYHSTDTHEITDLSVGTSGSEDVVMNTLDVESGKTVELEDFTITEPESTA